MLNDLTPPPLDPVHSMHIHTPPVVFSEVDELASAEVAPDNAGLEIPSVIELTINLNKVPLLNFSHVKQIGKPNSLRHGQFYIWYYTFFS